MPEADTSIQVTPGTTATVAVERVGAKLYQTVMFADAYGQVVGSRNTYVASDRRTVAAANAWYLSLYNDTSSTFVEVTKVCISQSTSAAVTGLPRAFYLYRISIKSGGANATFAEYDTSSPGPTLARIKAARRPTAATTVGPPLAVCALNPEESGGPNWVELFNAAGEEPILLRGQQGVGIQQDGTAVTGLMSSYIVFRVRP